MRVHISYLIMSDKIIPTGARARNVVNINLAEDVTYWTRKWGITAEQLQKAVERTGPKEARVADYLRAKGIIRF